MNFEKPRCGQGLAGSDADDIAIEPPVSLAFTSGITCVDDWHCAVAGEGEASGKRFASSRRNSCCPGTMTTPAPTPPTAMATQSIRTA